MSNELEQYAIQQFVETGERFIRNYLEEHGVADRRLHAALHVWARPPAAQLIYVLEGVHQAFVVDWGDSDGPIGPVVDSAAGVVEHWSQAQPFTSHVFKLDTGGALIILQISGYAKGLADHHAYAEL